jgi:hypothetical protein
VGTTRRKSKGRRESGSFSALPHHILESPQYASLSAPAVKLLLDLFAQYRGNNNGDFCAVWSLMKKRGWRSRDTLAKSIKALLKSGFIIKTRQGGWNLACLYAVTWLAIDECGGKLDVSATRVPDNLWKVPDTDTVLN